MILPCFLFSLIYIRVYGHAKKLKKMIDTRNDDTIELSILWQSLFLYWDIMTYIMLRI